MPDPSLSDRVVELELLLTHLERDVESLSGVVLEQQKQIQSLNRLIAKLDDRVTRLGEEGEPRDPAAERPPHY